MAEADTNQMQEWLALAAGGDENSWRCLIERPSRTACGAWWPSDRPRLHGRLDPSDVLQDVYLEAIGQLGDFVRNSPMPFFLWLRFLDE